MLFHTYVYVLFLALCSTAYWSLNAQHRNKLLLLASVLFYSYWDYRFVCIPLASCFIDFFCGLKISQSDLKKERLFWLRLSLVTNIFILCLFKYSLFLTENFVSLAAYLFPRNPIELPTYIKNIILPLGVSFFTFQSIGYTVSVYRKQTKPCLSFVDFGLYVLFFPQLVAGPIETPKTLLSQLQSKIVFHSENLILGTRYFVAGLFLKLVVADNLNPYVDFIFSNEKTFSSLSLLFGAYGFLFQIYSDFYGYNLMACGSALFFGIRLQENFNKPYLSVGAQNFLQRWHITLSVWVRDFVFKPLGGIASHPFRNTIITMALIGLWHGASWKYILWGLLLGLLVSLEIAFKLKFYRSFFFKKSRLLKIWYIFTAFNVASFSFVFFRAKDLEHVFSYFHAMLKNFYIADDMQQICLFILMYIAFTLSFDAVKGYFVQVDKNWRQALARATIFALLSFSIILLQNSSKEPFFYFIF